MSRTPSVHLAVLFLLFIAFALCANAQPDGSAFYDLDMDSSIFSIGEHLMEAAVNGQFARFTTSPITKGIPLQPTSQPVHSNAAPMQHRQLTPVHGPIDMRDINNMPSFLGQHSSCIIRSHPANSHDRIVTEEQFPVMNIYQNSKEDELQYSLYTGQQLGHDSTLLGADQVVAQLPQYSMSCADALQTPYDQRSVIGDSEVLHPVVSALQSQSSPQSLNQFSAPAYMMVHEEPVHQSASSYEPIYSTGAVEADLSLSAEVTSNWNYHAGMMIGAPNMAGWLQRASNAGDRVMPRVDTTHLAPPLVLDAVNRSPTSASTTGSSSRTPRRSKFTMKGGAYPYTCEQPGCNCGFATSSGLTHHRKTHSAYNLRPHVCKDCSKRFSYKKDLVRHRPQHDPNAPRYYCRLTDCKYSTRGFGRQDHLDRHVATLHRSNSIQ